MGMLTWSQITKIAVKIAVVAYKYSHLIFYDLSLMLFFVGERVSRSDDPVTGILANLLVEPSFGDIVADGISCGWLLNDNDGLDV
jgi:hypothetical protein